MNIRKLLMWLPVLSVAMAGCAREKPVEVSGLRFPVVVLYANTSTLMFKDAGDLKVMGVQLVINSNAAPALIDSGFVIYRLENLRSIHGGLWLMAHPAGATEVTFDLAKEKETGVEAARKLMRGQLEKETWRDDVEKQKRTLEKETTLQGMLDAVQPDEQ